MDSTSVQLAQHEERIKAIQSELASMKSDLKANTEEMVMLDTSVAKVLYVVDSVREMQSDIRALHSTITDIEKAIQQIPDMKRMLLWVSGIVVFILTGERVFL